MNYLEFKEIALGDKGSSGNHIYLIYRNISVPISFVIFKYTNILPNQISVSMIILLVLGVLLTLYSHIYLKQIVTIKILDLEILNLDFISPI